MGFFALRVLPPGHLVASNHPSELGLHVLHTVETLHLFVRITDWVSTNFLLYPQYDAHRTKTLSASAHCSTLSVQ